MILLHAELIRTRRPQAGSTWGPVEAALASRLETARTIMDPDYLTMS
jgi:hypothetical protein